MVIFVCKNRLKFLTIEFDQIWPESYSIWIQHSNSSFKIRSSDEFEVLMNSTQLTNQSHQTTHCWSKIDKLIEVNCSLLMQIIHKYFVYKTKVAHEPLPTLDQTSTIQKIDTFLILALKHVFAWLYFCLEWLTKSTYVLMLCLKVMMIKCFENVWETWGSVVFWV